MFFFLLIDFFAIYSNITGVIGNSSCEKVDNFGIKQDSLANIGKYVIGALALWHIFREVGVHTIA